MAQRELHGQISICSCLQVVSQNLAATLIMADAVERSVRTWMVTQQEQEIDYISKEIQSASTSLLTVVKHLGEYLTSEESETRVNGIKLLVEVIAKLPDSSFNRQSCRTMVSFLNTKLDSGEEAIPALKGLLRLSSIPIFTPTDCKEIIKALSAFNMRGYVQSVRHNVFLLLDSFLTRHRQVLKDMGSEFLKCYLALAEGEKDPRNLQIAFALDRILLLEFDITDLVEQFYDITFCYFPITFKAPANDPYGVSGTDLVQALKECLSASPLLGPPGMPLFIEKLNVGSPATKRDTMETIEACLPVYGPAVCQSFADKLWDGLKIEILQPVDDEVQKRALAVMVALVRTSHPTDGPVDGIALRILRSSLEILKEPEKARSQNAVKVLASLVSCSDHIAAWIWEPLITQLLESYDKATEQSTRVVVLETFASMLEAQLAASSSPDAKIPLPLLAQKDAVLSRFVSSLSSPATSEPSLDSIQKLIRLRILSQDEFRYVAHSLTNSLLDMCVSDDDLSFEIVSVLQHLAVVSSEIVEGVTLPALFALLPDDAASLSDETARGRCIHSLSVLETLCVAPALFSRLSVHLLTKLEMLVNGQEHMGSEAANATIAYGHALLRTIYTALSKKSEAQDPDVPRYIERFVPQLYALFVQPPPRGPEHRINLLETVLIKDASDIISVVVASLGIERQKAWLQALFAAFFEGEWTRLGLATGSVQAKRLFHSLEASEPGDLSPLFAAGLIGLRPETPIPVPDINELLRRITSVALSTENEGGRRALLTVAASILNKHGNECSAFINEDLETLWEERISRASPPEPRRAALEVWTMMVQALVVRNHPRGVALSMKLFTLFDDADMAENAARSLGRIPGLEGTVLVKKYHATIRLLYAQKLFSAITPEISKAMGLEPHAATKSLPYLIALSILIPSLPKGTYGQTIETLFPLLLRGLELPELELRTNIVEAFVTLVTRPDDINGMSVVTAHLGTLVGAMLNNARLNVERGPGLKLKVSALQFLEGLVGVVKQEDLQPFKARVLRELQAVLDDRSKVVRREAVVARSKWYKCNV